MTKLVDAEDSRSKECTSQRPIMNFDTKEFSLSNALFLDVARYFGTEKCKKQLFIYCNIYTANTAASFSN